MEKLIFAKKRKTLEGKTFTVYLTNFQKKDGSTQIMSVKFKDGVPLPKQSDCPMYILIEKDNCNISKSKYVRRDTGEESLTYTLWVGEWSKSERQYLDDSFDEFVTDDTEEEKAETVNVYSDTDSIHADNNI